MATKNTASKNLDKNQILAQNPITAHNIASKALAVHKWSMSEDILYTSGDFYLANQGLPTRILNSIPGAMDSVRFLSETVVANDNSGATFAVDSMVTAAKDRKGNVVGIHRTFVNKNGRRLIPTKIREAVGVVRGSAFKVGQDAEKILLTTSVEEALALKLIFRDSTVWSAFYAKDLPHLEIPSSVKVVEICVGSNKLDIAAADITAKILHRAGVSVYFVTPVEGFGSFREEWVTSQA